MHDASYFYLFRRAYAQLETENYNKVVETASQAIQLNPKKADAYFV